MRERESSRAAIRGRWAAILLTVLLLFSLGVAGYALKWHAWVMYQIGRYHCEHGNGEAGLKWMMRASDSGNEHATFAVYELILTGTNEIPEAVRICRDAGKDPRTYFRSMRRVLSLHYECAFDPRRCLEAAAYAGDRESMEELEKIDAPTSQP